MQADSDLEKFKDVLFKVREAYKPILEDYAWLVADCSRNSDISKEVADKILLELGHK